MRKTEHRPKHLKGSGSYAGFLICAVVFCLSAAALIFHHVQLQGENQLFRSLSEQYHQEDEQTAADGEEEAELTNFGELYAQNPDIFGWIRIDGTPLDYPVMYTPRDPEYYLTHSFDRRRSSGGVPFVGEGYQTESSNLIIYGHKMKSGTMFSTVLEYAEPEFWREHPVIHFDTPDQGNDYEVIAAFYSKVYYSDETDVFRYYDYHDIQTPERFDEYIEACKRASAYDTGLAAEYGESLITLSTCSYYTQNGRFVVVAKKI